MKKIYILILISLCSLQASAKVTIADVDRDTAWFAAQNPTVPQSDIDYQWNLNKPPQEVDNKNWELRVWTSITRGGRYGYVTRTWFGKFDKKTGRFLGYINQHEESDSINGPHWQ